MVPGGPDLWQDVSDVRVPYTLVRGSLSPVVDDDDVAELRRRQPDVRVVVVDGAGHSVQGDRPLELAALARRRAQRLELTQASTRSASTGSVTAPDPSTTSWNAATSKRSCNSVSAWARRRSISIWPTL